LNHKKLRKLIQINSDIRSNHSLKYTTVHIPESLAVLIDKLIENEEFAYTSRSEFIKDAVRKSLKYHGYYPQAGLSLEKLKVSLDSLMLNEEKEKTVAEMNARIKMPQDVKRTVNENVQNVDP
jgi:Arc/MetJ-type ribon-helix-helix transcriptional regulator